MGGGDLNLKKSWHPSTMKNMEKVWKAEQRHEQEKKKIAELQREIREEREREEIRKFAEDGGVIEKKDECKLDWMYKGPGGVVSREDYLLGRAIDKSFDLLEEAEKESATEGRSSQGLPGRSGILDDQVDIARKLQEDPLLLIKKKEMETRSQLLNNPVKLKQLQKMLRDEKVKVGKKSKKKSKKKRRRRSSSSSSSSSSSDRDEKDLDQLLAAKYCRLKDRLNNVDVEKLLSNDEKKRKESREASSSHGEERGTYSGQRHDDSKGHSKEYGLSKPSGYEKRPSWKPAAAPSDAPQKVPKPSSKPSTMPQQQRGQKRPLTEEEKEKRRREMMDNARWRDEQRERNVRHHREEERKEKEAEKREYDTTFLRKQLSLAASVGTVEGRIKSNINNIQRSGRAMDKNFAKR